MGPYSDDGVSHKGDCLNRRTHSRERTSGCSTLGAGMRSCTQSGVIYKIYIYIYICIRSHFGSSRVLQALSQAEVLSSVGVPPPSVRIIMVIIVNRSSSDKKSPSTMPVFVTLRTLSGEAITLTTRTNATVLYTGTILATRPRHLTMKLISSRTCMVLWRLSRVSRLRQIKALLLSEHPKLNHIFKTESFSVYVCVPGPWCKQLGVRRVPGSPDTIIV